MAAAAGGYRTFGFWGVFTAAILAAWALLLGMSLSLSNPGSGTGVLGVLRWAGEICRAGAEPQEFRALLLMWSLMALAMMGPGAVPFLSVYAGLGRAGGRRPPQGGLPALAAGYLLVWLGYAVLAASLQTVLYAQGLVDRVGIAETPWAVAALLALAGGYQLTAWKEACLVKCREPFRFFFARWRDGAGGALVMGLQQGMFCAACCWALMLLAFVGGVMNTLWMVAATGIMVLEKLPGPRNHIRGTVALILLVAAAAVAIRAAVVD